MLAWGGNHFTPLLPIYRDLLHFSTFDAALLLAAYVLGLVPALLAGAALAARIGVRVVLAVALGAGILGSALLAAGSGSFGMLATGRILAGVGIGAAMTAGVDLIRRLHVARAGATDAGGLLRGSMTVTAGLAAGAAVSGAVATWLPLPALAPYLAHGIVSLAAGIPLVTARLPAPPLGGRPGLGLPSGTGRMRLLAILLPAPWVFAAASIAYAEVPALMTTVPQEWRVAYAAALTLLTLGVGTAVQPLGARVAARGTRIATGLGLAVMVPGLAIAAATALRSDPVAGAIASAVLGAGFGLTLIAGLTAIRALVAAGGGGALLGAYYAATYLGFGAPALITAISGPGGAAVPLAGVAVFAAGCSAVLLPRRGG